MPALTAAWEYAKEDVTTRLPGWQSADYLGNGIYYDESDGCHQLRQQPVELLKWEYAGCRRLASIGSNPAFH